MAALVIEVTTFLSVAVLSAAYSHFHLAVPFHHQYPYQFYAKVLGRLGVNSFLLLAARWGRGNLRSLVTSCLRYGRRMALRSVTSTTLRI